MARGLKVRGASQAACISGGRLNGKAVLDNGRATATATDSFTAVGNTVNGHTRVVAGADTFSGRNIRPRCNRVGSNDLILITLTFTK